MTLPRIHITTVPGEPRRDALVAQYVESYPDTCIHADPDRRGVLWNHLTVLNCLLAESGRWGLTVQDDVVALPGWEDHLEQVMWNAPRPFVSLAHLSKYGRKLVNRGVPFGEGINATWGQAMLYHRNVLTRYTALAQTVSDMDYERYRKWDDGLTAVYNLLYGGKSCFTSRALFEHQNWESTMGNVPGQWRHADATIANCRLEPRWGVSPRAKPGAPSVEKVQRELAERLMREGRA